MDQKKWAFDLGQAVSISRSGEIGSIKGRAEYSNGVDMFYLEYRAADGRADKDWFRADELRAN